MKINDYDLLFIDVFEKIEDLQDKKYDLFISGYNNEKMVTDVFNSMIAVNKTWLIFPDYIELDSSKYSGNDYFEYTSEIIDYNNIESAYIKKFLNHYKLNERHTESICIDITGFIKPYMLYLILSLKYLNYNNIDIIYSEPKSYTNNEDTPFSISETKIVRSLDWNILRVEPGKNDLLLINVGYDNILVDNVVNYYKRVGNHKILLGFPSLQPIMYQENILNLIKSSENLNINQTFQPIFAAANDPFETAKIINTEINKYIKETEEVKIIYLAPLATKAQALGIVFFYIKEFARFEEKGIRLKIVYPFTKLYSSSSTEELSKINRYTLEF